MKILVSAPANGDRRSLARYWLLAIGYETLARNLAATDLS